MRKPYQDIVIPGEQMRSRNISRRGRSLYNEEKWEKFIEPLLPKDCQGKVFIELGCAEGLFLRKAKDRGFERVVGVEANKDAVEWAKRYRNANGSDYTILHRKVQIINDASNVVVNILNSTKHRRLTAKELPAADVVLMSNFHYFLKTKFIQNLLDVFLRKAVCCIIVSWNTDRIKRKYKSSPSKEAVRRYFKNWKEIKSIDSKSMYSICFDSGLVRYDLTGTKLRSTRSIDKVRARPEDTRKQIRQARNYFRILRKSVLQTGITEPILINDEGTVVDGRNRIWIEKMRGAGSIIARQV